MKTRRRKDARLLALLSLLALLPLVIWACGDAGDPPGAPSGPVTKYDPRMDQRGATITASATVPVWSPGGTFGISATFKDANGVPIEGAPLAVFPEAGFNQPNFTFNTNPTLTDVNGMASIKVGVPADCPPDSYTFEVATYPAGPVDGPQARAFVHVVVSGTAGSPVVTGVTLSTTTPSVVLPGDAIFQAVATATANCTLALSYKAAGAGLNVTTWTPVPGTNPWLFRLTPTSAGTLTVFVGAYCAETGVGLASDPVSVSVTAAP